MVWPLLDSSRSKKCDTFHCGLEQQWRFFLSQSLFLSYEIQNVHELKFPSCYNIQTHSIYTKVCTTELVFPMPDMVSLEVIICHYSSALVSALSAVIIVTSLAASHCLPLTLSLLQEQHTFRLTLSHSLSLSLRLLNIPVCTRSSWSWDRTYRRLTHKLNLTTAPRSSTRTRTPRAGKLRDHRIPSPLYIVVNIRLRRCLICSCRWPVHLGYGLDDRASISGRDWDSVISTTSRPALEPTQPPIHWIPGSLFPA
jgi:hypothetical protein